MKIAIGSDHRGFKLKSALIEFLRKKKHKVEDKGTFSTDSCDYPVYCYRAAVSVSKKKADRAILICKTGIGSAIAANKVKGVRAALVHNIKGAKFSRLHNDANVLVMGADFVDVILAKRIVSVWLSAEFEGGRHLRRVRQIKKIEEGYEL